MLDGPSSTIKSMMDDCFVSASSIADLTTEDRVRLLLEQSCARVQFRSSRPIKEVIILEMVRM